jgi:lysine 2,3-aminomutase
MHALPIATTHPSHLHPPGQRPAAPAEQTAHRDLLEGTFWQRLPGYRDIDETTFLDHHWQSRQSVTGVRRLHDALGGTLPESFYTDVEEGLGRAPMSVRITPYVIALIDWDEWRTDPLRRQFLPLGSELAADHPMVGLDSLAEQAHSPVPGLTHRYPDKALFLALDTCPVYCRYCTRSYAVGMDTEGVDKVQMSAQSARWEKAFEYIRSRPELEDIVVSGGDGFSLKPAHLSAIGDALLGIDHIRRIRIATKGPAVMPMKLLTDDAWTGTLIDVARRGREMGKDVVLHTHFGHPRELTDITRRALSRLFAAGVTMRSQCVLLRGVNDDAATMQLLVRRMGYLNVQAYYVYQHDLVRGVEDLRTTLSTALELEKQVRGATAGFNTPTFVVDLPGGGGKRDAHSFDHYDRVTGISVYRSPNTDDLHGADPNGVGPGRFFLYFDPIALLPEEGQKRWAKRGEHRRMITKAIEAARRALTPERTKRKAPARTARFPLGEDTAQPQSGRGLRSAPEPA